MCFLKGIIVLIICALAFCAPIYSADGEPVKYSLDLSNFGGASFVRCEFTGIGSVIITIGAIPNSVFQFQESTMMGQLTLQGNATPTVNVTFLVNSSVIQGPLTFNKLIIFKSQIILLNCTIEPLAFIRIGSNVLVESIFTVRNNKFRTAKLPVLTFSGASGVNDSSISIADNLFEEMQTLDRVINANSYILFQSTALRSQFRIHNNVIFCGIFMKGFFESSLGQSVGNSYSMEANVDSNCSSFLLMAGRSTRGFSGPRDPTFVTLHNNTFSGDVSIFDGVNVQLNFTAANSLNRSSLKIGLSNIDVVAFHLSGSVVGSINQRGTSGSVQNFSVENCILHDQVGISAKLIDGPCEFRNNTLHGTIAFDDANWTEKSSVRIVGNVFNSHQLEESTHFFRIDQAAMPTTSFQGSVVIANNVVWNHTVLKKACSSCNAMPSDIVTLYHTFSGSGEICIVNNTFHRNPSFQGTSFRIGGVLQGKRIVFSSNYFHGNFGFSNGNQSNLTFFKNRFVNGTVTVAGEPKIMVRWDENELRGVESFSLIGAEVSDSFFKYSGYLSSITFGPGSFSRSAVKVVNSVIGKFHLNDLACDKSTFVIANTSFTRDNKFAACIQMVKVTMNDSSFMVEHGDLSFGDSSSGLNSISCLFLRSMLILRENTFHCSSPKSSPAVSLTSGTVTGGFVPPLLNSTFVMEDNNITSSCMSSFRLTSASAGTPQTVFIFRRNFFGSSVTFDLATSSPPTAQLYMESNTFGSSSQGASFTAEAVQVMLFEADHTSNFTTFSLTHAEISKIFFRGSAVREAFFTVIAAVNNESTIISFENVTFASPSRAGIRVSNSLIDGWKDAVLNNFLFKVQNCTCISGIEKCFVYSGVAPFNHSSFLVIADSKFDSPNGLDVGAELYPSSSITLINNQFTCKPTTQFSPSIRLADRTRGTGSHNGILISGNSFLRCNFKAFPLRFNTDTVAIFYNNSFMDCSPSLGNCPLTYLHSNFFQQNVTILSTEQLVYASCNTGETLPPVAKQAECNTKVDFWRNCSSAGTFMVPFQSGVEFSCVPIPLQQLMNLQPDSSVVPEISFNEMVPLAFSNICLNLCPHCLLEAASLSTENPTQPTSNAPTTPRPVNLSLPPSNRTVTPLVTAEVHVSSAVLSTSFAITRQLSVAVTSTSTVSSTIGIPKSSYTASSAVAITKESQLPLVGSLTATVPTSPQNISPPRQPINSTKSLVGPVATAQAPSVTYLLSNIVGKSTPAIYGTGVATSAAAGVLSPTAANKAHNAGKLLATIVCQFGEDGGEDVVSPAWSEVFLPIALGDENALFSRALGAILSTTGLLVMSLMCVLFAANGKKQPAKNNKRVKLQRLAGICFVLVLSFYGPNVGSLALTVLLHAPNAVQPVATGGLAIVIAVVSLLSFLGSYAVASKFVVSADGNECQAISMTDVPSSAKAGVEETELSNSENPSNSRELRPLLLALSPLFDAAVDAAPLKFRLVGIEDISVAFAIGLLAGIRPSSFDHCRFIAGAQSTVTILHVGYLIGFRPYLSSIEQWTTTFLAVIQLGIGLSTLISTAGLPPKSTDWSVRSAGWLVVVLNFGVYAQLFVLCLVEFWKYRQRLKAAQAMSDTLDASALEVPMLERDDDALRAEGDRRESSGSPAHNPLRDVGTT